MIQCEGTVGKGPGEEFFPSQGIYQNKDCLSLGELQKDICPNTGICGSQQQQVHGSVTAKPEMQILYGINPKVSYMTVNILQMKGMCGGT